jgi:hypothetical protein
MPSAVKPQETFRQFIEKLDADQKLYPNDHTFIEAKDAEIGFWHNLAAVLNRAYSDTFINDDTPINVVTKLAKKSLHRLVELKGKN